MGDSRILGMCYQVLKQIGQGSMGKVYLAYDMRLKKQWAMKKVSRSTGDLFPEWDILKDLEHPGLPKVVDVLETEDSFYYVMDYVPGHNLKEISESGVKIRIREILQWGIQLAQVLEYLHGQKIPILYRDLKPSNVIIQPNRKVKLVDFGIAIATQDTRKGIRGWGTSGYAAKEQQEGKEDIRSDIYSLGAVLLYLLNHSKGGMNRRLLHCIEKCMEQDSRKRYASARQLELELQEILNRMNRNIRLRRTGFLCMLTGCLVLEYFLYEVKTEQEKSLRMEQIGSVLQSRNASVWEDLKQQLSQYSVDINWDNAGILMESAKQELSQMETSFRKAECLLTLSNYYISYADELREGKEYAWNQAEELLLSGLELASQCPGETLRMAYEVEFLMALNRLYEMEGREDAEDFKKKALEKAEEYSYVVKGREKDEE